MSDLGADPFEHAQLAFGESPDAARVVPSIFARRDRMRPRMSLEMNQAGQHLIRESQGETVLFTLFDVHQPICCVPSEAVKLRELFDMIIGGSDDTVSATDREMCVRFRDRIVADPTKTEAVRGER